MRIKTDVVIVGTGVAGMFSALKLPRDKKIVIITKEDMRSSDSFLAQGGICVLHDENDYDSYFEAHHEGRTLRKQKRVGRHYDPRLQRHH